MTEGSQPWFAAEAPAQTGKRHAPATARNRDAIAQLLREILPPAGLVLEIASGSGEHIVHFARLFPALHWLPSDPDPDALGSITAWVDEAALPNIASPVRLDASEPASWPVETADAILCINMIHISPWAATLGLLEGAAALLPAGAPLYLYGPYLQQGVETAPSNLAFDRSLRQRNPDWGIRSVQEVESAAAARGFSLERTVAMPANNLSLIFRRGPRPG